MFLFCIIYVLFIYGMSLSYATDPGCSVNPYDNIYSDEMEEWKDIEDVAPVVCGAFVEGLEYTVEYTIMPEADEWVEILLPNPNELCDDSGEFSFSDDLRALGDRLCDTHLVFVITPYCSNGENGIPVVLSILIECNDDNFGAEREGTNIMARIEELITEVNGDGPEIIVGTPCPTDDVPCIKAHIATVIDSFYIPVYAMPLMSKSKQANVEDSAIGISCFPNPAQNNVNFDLHTHTSMEESMTLTISDPYGKIVYSFISVGDLPKRLSVDISELTSGIYFYQFVAGNDKQSGRIIKQ